MIIYWLLLEITLNTCIRSTVPRTTLDRYNSASKDWQYWTALLLFYSIPVSWFFNDNQSSPIATLLGTALFAIGGALNIWAMMSNPYFVPNIEVPAKVVIDGAYGRFDHPGYAGMGLMATATWLMVGHSLAIIPLAAYLTLLLWRAQKESSLIYQ